MRKVFKRGFAAAMLMVMVFTMNVFGYDTGTGTVKVPTGSSYVVAKKGVKRTKNYSYAIVKANSVYPVEEGKKDTYTKCITRLYYGETPISSPKTLIEGNLTHVDIYEGQIGRAKFDIKFAGNSPSLAAHVAYYYNGK